MASWHTDEHHPHKNIAAFLYEPCQEIMALSVLRKCILQPRMRSHPLGLDVWLSLCVRTAKALGSLRGFPRLAWSFAGRLCDKCHNLMSIPTAMRIGAGIFSFITVSNNLVKTQIPVTIFDLPQIITASIYWRGTWKTSDNRLYKGIEYTYTCGQSIKPMSDAFILT